MTCLPAADLILENFTALPLAEAVPAPELIAIKGNRILYAGLRDAMSYLASSSIQLVFKDLILICSYHYLLFSL